MNLVQKQNSEKEKIINKKNAIIYIALTITILILAFQLTGSLLGRFRYDEMYFLHNSWAAYKGYSDLLYSPPTLNYLLKIYWTLVDGDIKTIWAIRLFLLVFVILQAYCMLKLLNYIHIENRTYKKIFIYCACLIYITINTAYRGYELRPEVFPNTVILLSALSLFRLTDDNKIQEKNIPLGIVSIILLIMASIISLRHVLINAILLLMLAIALIKIKRNNYQFLFKRNVLVFLTITLLICLSIFAILFYEEVINKIIEISKFQNSREARTWVEKITIGGYQSQIYIKAVLITTALILTSISESKYKFTYQFFIALLLFYLFLFTLDRQPHEYIRSIEWVLLTIICISALKDISENIKIENIKINTTNRIELSIMIIAVVIIIYYGSAALISAKFQSPLNPLYTKNITIAVQIIALTLLSFIKIKENDKFKYRILTNAICGVLAIILLLMMGHDVKGYRSTQVAVIIILTVLIILNLPKKANLILIKKISTSFMVVSYIYIYMECVNLLYVNENSVKIISSIINSKSNNEIKDLSIKEFGELMLTSTSILDQINSRDTFCKIHKDGFAIVYKWSYHPICVRDQGSYQLTLVPNGGKLTLDRIELERFDFISLPVSALSWASNLPVVYTKIIDHVWIKNIK